MPTNTIYRTTLGYLGSHRFYIEIIPNHNTELSSPTIVEIPLGAFDKDWAIDKKMNDELFGAQAPDGLAITVDLEMLPDDLKSILLNPFTNVDLTSYMPFKQPTRQDVPPFARTNVWRIKTDRGDDELTADNFLVMNAFGMKKNPSLKHIVTNTNLVKKHKIDLVLHDIVRICAEAIHPIFITWQAIEEANNSNTKKVKRMYDIVYGNNGSVTDFITVRVFYDNPTYPTSTTVDGVLIALGEYILYQDVLSGQLKILQLVDDTIPIWTAVKSFSEGTLTVNDAVYIEAGTYADELFLIELTAYPLPGGDYAINLRPTSNVATLTSVVAKIDGNTNGVYAHYFTHAKHDNMIENVFAIIYKMLMRVGTGYDIYYSDTMLATTFYKQSYDRLYTRGTALPNDEIYICGLVENTGVWFDGYYAENDDNYGMYEYENIWDMFEKMKGMGQSISYYTTGNNSFYVKANNLKGAVTGLSIDEWEISDLKIGDGAENELETGKGTMRGAVVNVNTNGDDKNEHKYILNGSIAESEYNVKAMFHNNPSVDVAEKGWVDTKDYPELKTSLIRLAQKQDNPERPFDAYKLCYFATPTDLADEEMCIRVHSSIKAEISNVVLDYTTMPFLNLPIEGNPWNALKIKFIDMQRYSGMPYILARAFATLFARADLGTIEVKAPVEFVAYKPVGESVTLDISSLINSSSDMNLSTDWLIESVKIVGHEKEAVVTLRQVR